MEEARTNVDVDKHERGFRKIAWAFLKVLYLVRSFFKISVFNLYIMISMYLLACGYQRCAEC